MNSEQLRSINTSASNKFSVNKYGRPTRDVDNGNAELGEKTISEEGQTSKAP